MRKKYLVFLLIVLSPIYLISGLSVIDYILGSLFGFLGVYIFLYQKKLKYSSYLISFLLAISVGIRLSNLIFLIAILFLLVFKDKNISDAFKVFTVTIFLAATLYFPFYNNLFSFYIDEGIYDSALDMSCIINLTNTNHDLIGRLGRFFLKQINFLGTMGFLFFLWLIKDVKVKINNHNLIFFLIFILFQISFLRLPTEEGHMIPSFIALLLFLSTLNKVNKKILLLVIVFTFLSNFVDIKFYEVDKVDSASEIALNLTIEDGFFIEDLNSRNEKGGNKKFNYRNAQFTIFEAWKNGCPN